MIISETKNQLSKFKKSNLKSDKDVIYYERKEKEVEVKSEEIREALNIKVSDITNSLNAKELADELKISFNKFCEIAAYLECPIKNPQGRIQAETHTRLFEFIQNRIDVQTTILMLSYFIVDKNHLFYLQFFKKFYTFRH